MGEKGLSCLDGGDNEPIFGKEAQRCDFLTRDGFVNKCGLFGASFFKTKACPLEMF
jgi:hypothetical protein